MISKSTTSKELLESLSRLEPAKDTDESLRKLLVAKARSDLIKYEVMVKNFSKKYSMDFYEFKESKLMQEPPFEVEQDYFDWELAITRLDEIREELGKLELLFL